MSVKIQISCKMAKMSLNIDRLITGMKEKHQTERLTADRWFLVNHGHRCSYAEKGLLKNAAKYLKQSPSGFIQVINYANRNFELLIDYLEPDLAPFSKLNLEHITPFFFYPQPVLTQLNSVFDNSIKYSLQHYDLDAQYARVVYRPESEKNSIELSTRQIRLAPLKVQSFLAHKMQIAGYLHQAFVDELVWPEIGLNAS